MQYIIKPPSVQNSCSNEPALEPIAPENNPSKQGSDGDLIPLVPLVPRK